MCYFSIGSLNARHKIHFLLLVPLFLSDNLLDNFRTVAVSERQNLEYEDSLKKNNVFSFTSTDLIHQAFLLTVWAVKIANAFFQNTFGNYFNSTGTRILYTLLNTNHNHRFPVSY